MAKKRNKKTVEKIKADELKVAESTSKQEDVLDKKRENITDLFNSSYQKSVDMTKLDKAPEKSWIKFFFLILFILIIIAGVVGAGFWFFSGTDFAGKKDDKVNLSLNLPQESASGEQIEFEVVYENKDNAAIKEGNIMIHYPQGFYFQKADPQPNTGDNSWNIANVPSGAGGKIKVIGQIVGELNEIKEFTAFINYKPENFNSDFQENTSQKVKINSTIVNVDTALPESVFTGQEIEYKINFINTSSLTLPNAKVIVEYPSGFSFSSAEPEATVNNNNWEFMEIASNEEVTLSIKGTISGKSKEEKEFNFQLGLAEPNGFFNKQVEKTDKVLIVNPSVKLKLEAPEIISAGSTVDYKITVENISDIDINDIELKLAFTEGFTEKKIATLDKIAILEKGSQKELIYKANIKKKISDNQDSLKVTLSVANAKVAGKDYSFTDTAEAESRIKGDIKFTAQARYYDDDLTKIGDGPLPPKVGKETSLVVWWSVKAQGADLENVTATAALPEYVSNVSDISEGLKYDKKNNILEWKISNLVKNEEQKGYFTVTLLPTKNQLNKLLIITKEAVVNAVDVNTKENISLNVEKLTSDIPNDPAASGKGVVIE